MEERQVTLDGVRYPLSEFFTAIATQNPVEFEGTYPLPEAQLDRFLAKVRIGYPAADEETEILHRYQQGFDPQRLDKLGLGTLESEVLAAARRDAASVNVEPTLFRYIGEIVRRTRTWPALTLGASPRASVALLLMSKSLAAIEGRDYLVPDDVKSAAPAVLRHRLVVKPEADLEGITADRVTADIIATVEVPK
jgi:MoxR-like ATPase